MKEIQKKFWVDTLSVFSLVSCLKLAFRCKETTHFYYVKISFIANIILKCFRILKIFPNKQEQIKYSLGDLKIENQTMGMKFQFDLPRISRRIVENLRKNVVYKEIISILPEEKIELYFEKKISEELSELIYLYLIIQWDKKQNESTYQNILLCEYSPVVTEFKSIMEDNSFVLSCYYSFNYYSFLIKKMIKNFYRQHFFLRKLEIDKKLYHSSKPSIGLHYVFGLRRGMQNDIFWYSQSKINPERVLLYLDLDAKVYKVPQDIMNQINNLNMRWICLRNRALPRSNVHRTSRIKYFRLDKSMQRILPLIIKSRFELESWITVTAKDIALEIDFWISFFRFFNIRIVFDMAAQTTESLAQSIALDFIDGVRIGVQRSTLSLVEYAPFLRYNANEIYFVWGSEVKMHCGTSKIIKNFVISGYPYDDIFLNNDSKEKFFYKLKDKEKKGKFIIALFDNAFAKELHFSKNIMIIFYSKFLKWLLEDEDIVLITKEKKPQSLDRLNEIENLFLQAEKTGRFIRLKNVFGRFPSDASIQADVSVGIGVSSAVAEVVVAGYKGVNCDLPRHSYHPYYKWGYERVIFDDIERLLSVLKRYKADSSNEPELGDWTSYLNNLDPFRDGKAGQRIGTYMRWLLESFDAGKNRVEAIQYANEQYTKQWGEDKVIDMRNNDETT